MRYNSRVNPREAKSVARQKYSERQVDRWIKWTMENKGYMFYKDLIEKQNEFNIVCYE
jgi:hypothetical protein